MTIPAYSFRVVWSDEDQAFVATCPEFDGVSGLAESPGDALVEAQAALRLMVETYQVEGWPLPSAESLQEYSGQFRLRVPRSLHARLAQLAADEGVSLNSFAVSLLSCGLGEHASGATTARRLQTLLMELQAFALRPHLVASRDTAFEASFNGDTRVSQGVYTSASAFLGGVAWQS
ncbi:MAG: toxin-antitoxin system HicB family antitoxin [Gemmatimonadaceae bacterium]|nr:toxin-antitoxin system HicB family antitoxin [Gemmatimonadaceae bacterium]